MHEFFFQLLKEGPWFALAIAILLAISRGVKYVGRRMMDKDSGFIPRIVQKHEEFLESTMRTNDRMMVAVMGCTDQIKALERRLESAWTARHSDPEIWDVLFTNNPVPMAMISRTGEFLQVNLALCTLLGYTSVELKATSWQALTPAAGLADETAQRDELVIGNIDVIRRKKKLIGKSGDPVNVVLHGFRYPRMGAFRHFFAFYMPDNQN